MTATPMTTADGADELQRLRIDFLFLDLTTCTRCLGANRSLESALALVADALRGAGVQTDVNKVLVQSTEQARALRFVSSPTIRLDGQDIALELRESPCGSQACTDSCGGQTACRVWVHRGREHTEPPVAMVVEAILRHLYGGAPVPPTTAGEPYELPENLARFFAGKAGQASSTPVACCGDAAA